MRMESQTILHSYKWMRRGIDFCPAKSTYFSDFLCSIFCFRMISMEMEITAATIIEDLNFITSASIKRDLVKS